MVDIMEMARMFLSRLSIVIGVVSVFLGMSDSEMTLVIGGGFFMALGIVFIVLERN